MTLRKSSGGFTLIELMIVLVIVGVLALVAYPAFQSSVIKANRAEAKAYLLDLAQRQQLFFNDTRTYADSSAALNSIAPERVANNYVVTFDVSTITPPPTFTISATPIVNTIQQGDGVLSINNAGAKDHNGAPW